LATALEKQLSKNELSALVKQKHLSLRFMKRTQTDRMSKWLSRFSLILVDDVRQDFVICDTCKTVVPDKTSTGTGGLQRHVESYEGKTKDALANQTDITSFFPAHNSSKSGMVNRMETSITTACAEFVATDGRSFETTNGSGFKRLFGLAFQAGRSLNIFCLMFPRMIFCPCLSQ
jgi:hypothetical protein